MNTSMLGISNEHHGRPNFAKAWKVVIVCHPSLIIAMSPYITCIATIKRVQIKRLYGLFQG